VYGKQSSKIVRNAGGDEVNAGKTTTTYCTLYRIGYWASLDAKCKTEVDDYGDFTVLTHNVWYVLIGKYGDVTGMGHFIFSQYDVDDPTVSDEDGKDFPNLDEAIRAHAENLVTITAMPGLRVPSPPRHDLYDESVKTAFEAEPAV
jgi:hypothetical protein